MDRIPALVHGLPDGGLRISTRPDGTRPAAGIDRFALDRSRSSDVRVLNRGDAAALETQFSQNAGWCV